MPQQEEKREEAAEPAWKGTMFRFMVVYSLVNMFTTFQNGQKPAVVPHAFEDDALDTVPQVKRSCLAYLPRRPC